MNKLPTQQLASLLKQKSVLIVGGTAGIGRELAVSCLKHGAKVSIVGRRDPDQSLAQATFLKTDLSLMRNADALGKSIDWGVMDIVVFTNGIISAAKRQESSEGIELDMAVSYLSRYAILNNLNHTALGTKRADSTKKPRIFIMGYPGKPVKASNLDDLNSDTQYAQFSVHSKKISLT